MKKRVVIISAIIVLIMVVGLIVILTSNESADSNIKDNQAQNEQNKEEINEAPSKIDDDEKEVSEKKKEELFNYIPKIYIEGVAPFDSLFMLDAAMTKIIDTNEEVDFSVENVDNCITKIFGKDANIDKEEVSVPNVAKSLFYYSKDAKSYAVIPVGYEGIFEHQILKNVTETDEAYYVYTYALIGGYYYDEDSIVLDEFGDVDYEKAKVQVIVGDKDGNDLVHIFDNYNLMYDESIWVNKYANIMPVFRYTLSKDGNTYYLTEVEQIGY